MTATEIWIGSSILTVLAGIIGHLYREIYRLSASNQMDYDKQFSEVREAIEDVRTALEHDREQVAENRIEMANTVGKLVNRDDLRHEISRLIAEIDKRFWPTKGATS